jgi:hypothetical protein
MVDALWPLTFAVFLFAEPEWPVLILFALVLAVLLWVQFGRLRRRVGEFYAQRYGRADSSVLPPQNVGINMMMLINFREPLRDAFRAPDSLSVAIFLVGLCAYPLWIVRRDFPYRLHWLAVALAGFAAAMQIPFVPFGSAAYHWQRDTSLAIGLALLAAGALDHLLLVRALGGGTSEPLPDPERSDPRFQQGA